MKPFADRTAATDSVQATIRRLYGEGTQIRQATILPFNLPPIIGLSTSGGFEYLLEALEGQDPASLGSVMSGLINAANRDPRLARVFSTFTATNPSIYLDIDRTKAQALGLNMSDVFTALQATLAASMSTTSTCSGEPGKSTCRAKRATAATSAISGRSTCATAAAKWCRSARSPA